MAAELTGTARAGRAGRIRILIVEDDFGDVMLVREALNESNLDYELEHVADGEEAIEHLKTSAADSGATPDLVLLDLNLPKRDGWEVLEELRFNPATHDTPVVILTSSGSPADRLRASRSPHSIYVQKPESLGDFPAVGKRIEDFWSSSRKVN